MNEYTGTKAASQYHFSYQEIIWSNYNFERITPFSAGKVTVVIRWLNSGKRNRHYFFVLTMFLIKKKTELNQWIMPILWISMIWSYSLGIRFWTFRLIYLILRQPTQFQPRKIVFRPVFQGRAFLACSSGWASIHEHQKMSNFLRVFWCIWKFFHLPKRPRKC